MLFFHRLWNNVYNGWITSNFPCKWHRTGSTTSPGDPRWRRFSTETSLLSFHREQIEEDNREARETSLRTAEVMSSTQRPQTCTEAATKYNNYTASETDEEREHRLPTLQKNDKEIRQRLKFVSGRFAPQPISPRKLAPTLWTISPQFLHD